MLKKVLCGFFVFYHYSGLRFIKRKFIPPQENQAEGFLTKLRGLPTGFLWLFGIYIAFFGIASQRYENRVDVIENRANALFSQLSLMENFKFARVGDIQNMTCPEKPYIKYPLSVFRSLFFKNTRYSEISEHLKNTVTDYKYNLAGHALSKINLQGVDLSASDLYGAYLEGANLNGVNFNGANLEDADLRKTDLQNANFYGANLINADMSDANLKGILFERADLERADIKNVMFLNAEQLILADNIYALQNCPETILKEIEAYGCMEMLNKRPQTWSDSFKSHREKIVKKIQYKLNIEQRK